MKKSIKIYLTLYALSLTTIYGNSNDIWYSYKDAKTELIGFKDANHNIKIKPKFGGVTGAIKFDKIIAVSEFVNGKHANYYLAKNNKKVAINNMFIFDNGFDCESEGFIRFTDHKQNKVGLLNGDGDIAIPAVYSSLSRVQNGVIFTLSGALHRSDGEHTMLIGGRATLIDTKNNTLIENFADDRNINLYSMRIENTGYKLDKNRDYFKGVNGKSYSFINYEKEFKNWLEHNVHKELNEVKLKNHFFDEVSYADNKHTYVLQKKDLKHEFVRDTIGTLGGAKYKKATRHIFLEYINKYVFDDKKFTSYSDNCGESLEAYPVMSVVISNDHNGGIIQDSFDFLRTDRGYKLMSVTIRSR